MNFKDHFSDHAALYAQARPQYPEALFAWIAKTSPARGCVWDAGCGSGQASVALTRRFDRVIATDPSAEQIANAIADPRVEYRAETAEQTSLTDRSVDAVTVAQALHWFDLPPFIDEVRRVARPGALFAAWCYASCKVIPAVDKVIANLYDVTLNAYWPSERRLVDEGYASIDLPFTPVATPVLELRVDWSARQLLAYLSSWSATQRYRKATGHDAIAAIADELAAAWGDAKQPRAVRWQLAVRAGRVA